MSHSCDDNFSSQGGGGGKPYPIGNLTLLIVSYNAFAKKKKVKAFASFHGK